MLTQVDMMGAADELYAVLPEEFVARRAALATEAKDAGDKALSADIKKLAKPTTAAWVVNMLVRHEAEQVEQVLELGAALRQAQVSMAGDELRELGRQRRQLTAAVTRQARALAYDLGQKVGDPVATQVEETLHASMVDEDAAKAVRTGMLVKPLAVSGAEALGVAESVAVPGALGEDVVRRTPTPAARRPQKTESAKPELTVVEDDSRAIEEAEAAVAEAESQLAAAERGLVKAQRKVEKREARGLQLQAELDELRRKMAELEQKVEANEDELSDAEDARDAQEESVAEAQAVVERAGKALDSLR
jgi:hypothetical protein